MFTHSVRRRSYTAKPIYSADEHGATKFKMERFLHPGQSAMATVYAPISYSPLPLLAFQQDADSGEHRIAAVGKPSPLPYPPPYVVLVGAACLQ